MPEKQATGGDLVGEVAALLRGKVKGKENGEENGQENRQDNGEENGQENGTEGASPPSVTAESLDKLTQRQLAAAAKKMGLSPAPKIKKDALVKLVLDAWQALAPTGQGAAQAAEEIAEIPSPTAVAAGAEADRSALFHKFEVGEPGRVESEQSREMSRGSSREIPWGYGRDRVTAMPIDPERLFAYWEVLDESIAKARAQLGKGGPGAWLNLRVYDVTARIFDGTNAHGTSDHRIERGDRQWFLPIGKPTSELIVEIGMKSDEGFFAKIARSGRVEFPRREPAPPTEPEWLTVRMATGQVERAGVGLPGHTGRSAEPWAAGVAGLGHPETAPQLGAAWEDAVRVVTGGADRHQWEEMHASGSIEEHREFRWEEPAMIASWEAGPFPYPVEIPAPKREAFAGKTRIFRQGGRTHVVYGPWQVVIRGLQAERSRVILSRWEVYRSWAEETVHEVEEFGTTFEGSGDAGAGASERMMGSSGRRWVGSSERRFGGSSEQFFLKASETRLGGASERIYAGASELRFRGASERLYAGGSEAALRGASLPTGGRTMGASDNAYPQARSADARGADARVDDRDVGPSRQKG